VRGWGTPSSVVVETGGTSGSTHGLGYLFTALRRQGLIAERTLWNASLGLLRLDVGGPDHLGPLLGFVGDELAEVGRRTLKDRYAQGGKSRLDLGISEGGIDFLVELVDDLGRRALGNADTMPAAGLVVRHKFAQGWNVR
jgi:hypothetical protein